ncbi:MAG TPA: hypothetical protein VHW74_15310 [Mycobacteriales bacterium]|jgi:hypothetical protein|nr:hypothetical protein [Mycobacteriales bacterium]
MTILPSDPPEHARTALPWRYGVIAAIVVVAAVLAALVLRGGGSGSPSSAPSLAPVSPSLAPVRPSSGSSVIARPLPPEAPRGPIAGPPENPAAGQLLSQAEHAVAAQSWIEASVVQNVQVGSSVDEQLDQITLGPREAEDVETLAGQPTQQVIRVGQTVYLNANVWALTDRDGVASKVAKRVQDRWLRLEHGDGPYREVTSVFATGQNLAAGGVPMYGPYGGLGSSLVSPGKYGAVIYGWWDPQHSSYATLTVQQSAPHLPLDYDGRWGGHAQNVQVTASYSYHRQFEDPPPSHSVSWAEAG